MAQEIRHQKLSSHYRLSNFATSMPYDGLLPVQRELQVVRTSLCRMSEQFRGRSIRGHPQRRSHRLGDLSIERVVTSTNLTLAGFACD
jgi:hypothetical protein